MNNFLGQFLFPRQPRDVQRRKMTVILVVLLVSVLLGGAIALMLVLSNKTGAH
jgi:flagellar basal body-associated protein FliL